MKLTEEFEEYCLVDEWNWEYYDSVPHLLGGKRDYNSLRNYNLYAKDLDLYERLELVRLLFIVNSEGKTKDRYVRRPNLSPILSDYFDNKGNLSGWENLSKRIQMLYTGSYKEIDHRKTIVSMNEKLFSNHRYWKWVCSESVFIVMSLRLYKEEFPNWKSLIRILLMLPEDRHWIIDALNLNEFWSELFLRNLVRQVMFNKPSEVLKY